MYSQVLDTIIQVNQQKLHLDCFQYKYYWRKQLVIYQNHLFSLLKIVLEKIFALLICAR